MEIVYSALGIADAELVADQLRQAGIEVHLRNTQLNTLFGQLPSIPPEVWVENVSDFGRARGIVNQIEARRRAADMGTRACPSCHEDNPANFEVCWKCRQALGPQ